MGILFLVVGNSGSGKDSLITEVQKQFPLTEKTLIVPKRVITRPPSPETEDFDSVNESTFLEMKKNGKFVLDWFSYGIYYGIQKTVLEYLDQGHLVVVNVSRQVIDEARKTIPSTKVIFVHVPFEISEARIRERGREDPTAITSRLDRARKNQILQGADFIVDNSGKLEDAGREMLKYILSFL